MKQIILSITLLLSSPAFASDNDSDSRSNIPGPQPETLRGVSFNHDSLTIQVNTGGCTDKRSFQIYTQTSSPPTLVIMRNQPDGCRGYFPNGTKITYSFAELGMSTTEFYVGNQIDPGLIRPGRIVPN